MQSLHLAAFACIFFACTPGPANPKATTAAHELPTAPDIAPMTELVPVPAPTPAPPEELDLTPTFEELIDMVGLDGALMGLIGKWQSTKDPKYLLEYKPGKWLHYYEGELVETNEVIFRATCDATAAEIGPYMVLDKEICLYIASLGEKLVLDTENRRNPITFVRVD